MNVLEREVGGPEPEEGAHVGGDEQAEVILGIDPLIEVGPEGSFRGQEMQERKSMRIISSRPQGSADARNTIDSMDLDHFVEDHPETESGAVQHVGFNH